MYTINLSLSRFVELRQNGTISAHWQTVNAKEMQNVIRSVNETNEMDHELRCHSNKQYCTVQTKIYNNNIILILLDSSLLLHQLTHTHSNSNNREAFTNKRENKSIYYNQKSFDISIGPFQNKLFGILSPALKKL